MPDSELKTSGARKGRILLFQAPWFVVDSITEAQGIQHKENNSLALENSLTFLLLDTLVLLNFIN